MRFPPLPPWLTSYAREHVPDGPHYWPPEAINHRIPSAYALAVGAFLGMGSGREWHRIAAHGLDFRDPYEDESLIDFVLSLPGHALFRPGAGHSKTVVRAALRGLVPERVRIKPRTGRLGPLAQAFFQQHHTWMMERLWHPGRDWPRFVDERLAQHWCEGGASSTERLVLWRCVVYEHWRLMWR